MKKKLEELEHCLHAIMQGYYLYIMFISKQQPDGSWVISPDNVSELRRKYAVDYSELPNEEKGIFKFHARTIANIARGK